MPVDLVILEGEHTGKNIAAAFAKTMDRLEIWDKLLAITTDNASSMDTMFKALDKMCQDKMLEFKSAEHRVSCQAHIINLACKDIIKKVIGKDSGNANETETSAEDSDTEEHEPASLSFFFSKT